MAMPRQPQREAAKASGARYYFTAKPCKHGHLSARNTVDSSCLVCRQINTELWRREHNRKKAAEKRREMVERDPDAARAAWAAEGRRCRERNPELYRALYRKHGRLKRQRNPKGKLAEVRARQAATLQRTPAWADLRVIRTFYEQTPDGMVVDHVIPLRGRTVSGLHVIENLQYLTNAENLAKGNRFDDWSEGVRD